MTLGTFAQRNFPTEQEQLFNKKADKLLKRVRQASIEDRVTGKGRQVETSEIERLRRVVGIDRKPSGDVVSVMLKLTRSDTEELQSAGFKVGARIGEIATVETEVDNLLRLAALSSVEKLSASVIRYPTNDRARRGIGVDDNLGNRTVSQTGQGIVVGIVDTGIDFRHLDFTVPGTGGTKTRIKALLDMTVYGTDTRDPGWNYSLPGQSATIGRLYTQADLNAALAIAKPANQDSDLVKQRDQNGHGTHVAGTAAGNGLSASSSGVYAGIAPQADLIVVKASRQNDGTATFRNTDMVNALQFIEQQASQLNEPFVINLSLGGQSGPHDGTTPDERAIDNLINGGPGRAVCVAAGNDGDTNIHASGVVAAGGSLQLDLNVVNNPSFVDLYQAHSDRFTVTVTRPDGATLGPVSYDPSGFQMPHGQASDQFVDLYNANDDKGDMDPSNDQPDIYLVFKPGALSGTWRLTLNDADSTPNQLFDAWTDGGEVKFSNLVDNASHLVSSPGTSRGAITVGAFVTRSGTLTVGGFTPYTSPGPTADGRPKPDLEAPGHYLYSAKSTDITNSGVAFIDQLPAGDPNAAVDYVHYGGLAGTSMASPVAAGAAALLLQAFPSMTSDEIKYALTHTTMPDLFGGPDWNPRAGFGQLNVAAAIQLGRKKLFTISGHVANAPANGSIQVTLSGSQSSTAILDSSGNYTFGRLVEGGTYTVTPSATGLTLFTFSPVSYTFADLSSDKVADFTASKTAYTVSGKIRDSHGNGVSGIQVSSQIFPVGVVSTGIDGSYSFNLAAGQSYTITPTNTMYVFSPERFSILNLTKDETVDFTAIGPVKLNGSVKDGATNQGLAGVTLSLQLFGNPYATTQTDNTGHFEFASVPPGRSYLIEPTKSGYSFQPGAFSGTGLLEDTAFSFIGTAIPATIQFSFSSQSNNEGSGHTTVSVVRLGDTTREASVDFRTIDDDAPVRCDAPGTIAYARCDYATTIDTLHFAPGEVSRFAIVPLIDDGFTESIESFQLQLMNPSPGWVLGDITTTTVNIVDNDPVSKPNPIFSTSFFVREQYLDFLSREPEAGEPWSAMLNNCSDVNNDPNCDRTTVSAAFFGSPEFQLKGYYVYRFYKLALNRLPTYTEIVVDMRSVTGQTASEVYQKKAAFANAFVQRTEFANTYAGMIDAAYVSALMARHGEAQITTPDPAQPDGTNKVTLTTADLTNQLSGGMLTREQVLRAVVDSDQVFNGEYNSAFVAMQYYGYLRRAPEAAGYNAWLDYLNVHPADSRTMVDGFMNSAEYRLRFGPQ